mmetsp:Transcript_57383/g.136394  ORF Transcript_57383/g.136394 Transcript_57383/m.136394 type:complete len:289 (+) Transcript_57383:71-937(+)
MGCGASVTPNTAASNSKGPAANGQHPAFSTTTTVVVDQVDFVPDSRRMCCAELKEGTCAPLVICGPSAAGKSTLYKKLEALDDLPGLRFKKALQYTTRTRRHDEEDGCDYRFVSKEDFQKLEKEGGFATCGCLYRDAEDCYGMRCSEVKTKKSASGTLEIPILDIDVKRALGMQRKLAENGMRGFYVFILPPSEEELKSRLQQRKVEELEHCDTAEEREKVQRKEDAKIQKRYEYSFNECIQAMQEKDAWDLVLTSTDADRDNNLTKLQRWVRAFYLEGGLPPVPDNL